MATFSDAEGRLREANGRFAVEPHRETPDGLGALVTNLDAKAVMANELAGVAAPDPTAGSNSGWWIAAGDEEQVARAAFKALWRTGRIPPGAKTPPIDLTGRALRDEYAELIPDAQGMGYWFDPHQTLNAVQEIVEEAPVDTPRHTTDRNGASHWRFTDNLGRQVHEIRAHRGHLDCTTGPARTRLHPDGRKTQDWFLEGHSLDDGRGPLIRANADLAEDGIWQNLTPERRDQLCHLMPRGTRLDVDGVLWAPETIAGLASLIELTRMALD